MNRPRSSLSVLIRAGRPRGYSYRGLLFAIPVVLAVPLIAWFGLPRLTLSSEDGGPLTHVVQRGSFVHEVTEHGNVESAKNVEIRCEVESHGAGTMIIWIIPEGTYVEPAPDWKPEEPGEDPPDLLVKLDSSSLEKERTKQQIVCNTSEAVVIQARNNYETAKIAKEEYLKGTYEKEKEEIEAQIAVAQENLVRAEEYLEYSELLHAKGYISDRELQANRFDVRKKEIELEKAITSMRVLEDYTKPKMILQLEADINTTRARLESEEHSHQLDVDELTRIEEQIAKCTIRAPQAGQVVYANETDRRGGQEVIIEEGTMVRERQEIIRLPDSKNMQVEAKINEARVSLVKVGMPATIQLDAFTDMKLHGTVQKVNEYPEPSGWWSGNVKEYDTTIRIDDFPPDLELRPGMTAQVSIRVEQLDDVLLVPVQAVFEHGGKHYCALRHGEDWEARQVVIGSTNDKEVVIKEGLKAGEEVVLGAVRFRDKLGLPELPSETPTAAETAGGSSPAGQAKADSRPTKAKGAAGPGGAQAQGGFDPARVAQLFKTMDKNGDGRLENDEIPGQLKPNLSAVDTNADGAVDQGEFTAAMKRLSAAMGGAAGQGAPEGSRKPGRPEGERKREGPAGRQPAAKDRPKSSGGSQGARP